MLPHARREPRNDAGSIHEKEAREPERFYCDCGEQVGVEGEPCAECMSLDEGTCEDCGDPLDDDERCPRCSSERRYWDHVNQQIDERLGK